MTTVVIRKHRDRFQVCYPDESGMATPVPFFHRDGSREVVWCGEPAVKALTVAHEEPSSLDEARRLALFLVPGCEVQVEGRAAA